MTKKYFIIEKIVQVYNGGNINLPIFVYDFRKLDFKFKKIEKIEVAICAIMFLCCFFPFYSFASVVNSNLSNAGGDTLKNGLVGWWTMDGADIVNNIVDRSGTGNTGYMVNMATTTAKVSGKLGQALNFDGVDDYVSVGNPSNLNFGTGSFSYGLWVYATGLTTAYDMPIYKGGGGAGTPGFDMELGSSAWSSNIADGSVLKQRNFSSSPILNRWAHLFVTVNRSTNQYCAFLNGVQVSSCLDISTFGSVSGSTNLVFGRLATYALKGKIDDIRIYNRALSSSEVKALYNLGI